MKNAQRENKDSRLVHFTVIESLRTRGTASVSRADFEQETGVSLELASEVQIADYLLRANISYAEVSAPERIDDPVFVDVRIED